MAKKKYVDPEKLKAGQCFVPEGSKQVWMVDEFGEQAQQITGRGKGKVNDLNMLDDVVIVKITITTEAA